MNYKKRLGLCLAAVMIFSNAAGLMSMPAFADDVTNSTVTDMMELIPATGSTSGENSTETPTETPESETTPPTENSEGEATPPAENNEGETVPPTENKDDVIPMIPLQDIAKAVEVQDAKAESNGMNKADWNIVGESGDKIVLGEYIGQSSDVMIPSEMDGKQVYIEKFPGAAGLKASQEQCNNLNKITSVTTVSVNGGKVKPSNATPDARPVFGMPWTSNSDTLTSVDLSAYDISGYDTLQGMFARRKNLTTIIGLDKWDTSNIIDMRWLFKSTQFTDLEQLRNWGISNVTEIQNMFSPHTTNIDALSNWDVSKVNNAAYLFAHCDQIQDFTPISNWELGKNADKLNLTEMFHNSSMEFVDLSKWNIKEDTTTERMFLYKDDANPNQTKPLLVVTNSDKIKGYDFAASNRIGVQMIFKVDGQETAKSDAYLTISSADPASIKEIWEKETAKIAIPLKKDMIFDRWEPETPIKNAYDALSATYNAVFKPLNPTEPTEPTEPSKPDGSSRPDSSSRPNDVSRPEESHRPNDVSRPEESSKLETSVKPSKKPVGQESDKTDKTENTSAQTETVVSDNSSKPNPDTGDMGSLNMLSAMLAASSGTFAILLSKKKNHKK